MSVRGNRLGSADFAGGVGIEQPDSGYESSGASSSRGSPPPSEIEHDDAFVPARQRQSLAMRDAMLGVADANEFRKGAASASAIRRVSEYVGSVGNLKREYESLDERFRSARHDEYSGLLSEAVQLQEKASNIGALYHRSIVPTQRKLRVELEALDQLKAAKSERGERLGPGVAVDLAEVKQSINAVDRSKKEHAKTLGAINGLVFELTKAVPNPNRGPSWE